jgi:hypothetical protein
VLGREHTISKPGDPGIRHPYCRSKCDAKEKGTLVQVTVDGAPLEHFVRNHLEFDYW